MSSIFFNDSLLSPIFNANELANLCGSLHQNIHLIERFYKVSIKLKDEEIVVLGQSKDSIVHAKNILVRLHALAKSPIPLDAIQGLLHEEDNSVEMKQAIHLHRKTIKPRNAKQASYLNSIDEHALTLAVGPAGTGKTYLAVAKAIEAFERGEVLRLILARPAVEAGEKLGFLPGDIAEKVLPYLRPIYDALYEMIGFKETQKLLQGDVIEVLPLAFMRGRTLNEAFIILDEAQNTTITQMKMFLTRIGFGSKAVVTGDMTQVDLPKGTPSGLEHAVRILKPLKDIGLHQFSSAEVVRHPLVARIIDCYDKKED